MSKRRDTERTDEPQAAVATNGAPPSPPTAVASGLLEPNDETMSPNEAARRTGFSRHTIMDMIRKGWLTAYRAPGSAIHKIRRTDLERLIQASCLKKEPA